MSILLRQNCDLMKTDLTELPQQFVGLYSSYTRVSGISYHFRGGGLVKFICSVLGRLSDCVEKCLEATTAIR